jgi:hypothetical protein
MAFQTGSQINPALGAINYTPYMQGAVAGAQSIGQGIANLGQGVAQGIEGYYKKKEEKAQLDQATGVVSNLIKTDPQLAGYLGLRPNENGEFDQKAIKAGVKAVGVGPILQLAQNLQAQSAAKESEARVAQYILGKQKELEANQGVGVTPEGMVAGPAFQAAPVPRLTAVEEFSGQKSLMEMQQSQANLGKTLAETGAVGKKAPTQFSVAYNAFKSRYPNATPEQEQAFAEQYTASTRPTTNIVNTPENKGEAAFEETLNKSLAEQFIQIGSAADAAEQSAVRLDRVKALYDQGAYTGVGAELISGLGRLAANFGYNVPKQASQDQLEQILQEGALARTRELFKGSGSLSNLEGAKGEQTVANLARTPAGNIKILEWEARNAPVLRAADELKLSLREQNVKPEKIISEVKKYVRNNYIKLEDVASGKANNLTEEEVNL